MIPMAPGFFRPIVSANTFFDDTFGGSGSLYQRVADSGQTWNAWNYDAVPNSAGTITGGFLKRIQISGNTYEVVLADVISGVSIVAPARVEVYFRVVGLPSTSNDSETFTLSLENQDNGNSFAVQLYIGHFAPQEYGLAPLKEGNNLAGFTGSAASLNGLNLIARCDLSSDGDTVTYSLINADTSSVIQTGSADGYGPQIGPFTRVGFGWVNSLYIRAPLFEMDRIRAYPL